MTTTLELIDYYADLLILQYHGDNSNSAAIRTLVNPVVMPQTSTQEISFATAPASGAFVLDYDGHLSASINWNDSNATIQTKIQAVTGLGSVTVAGEIATLSLVVTFTGVAPPAVLLLLHSSTLNVTPTIAETDLILPLAVQAGFNLTGDNTAVGAQLDILGKYTGVTRTGRGFSTQITLDDADFLTLIQVAIIKNSSGSSLSEIQALIHQFFNGEILVFDYQTMRMSYLISTTVGSTDLVQLFVSEKLLPVPMAVGVSVIYFPVVTEFFNFRTYDAPAVNGNPFNDYTDYQTDWPWLSYANAVVI